MGTSTRSHLIVCALLTAFVSSAPAQEPSVVELAPDHAVVWSADGATIAYRGRYNRFTFRLAHRDGVALPVRYTRLITGATREVRHFLELAAWNAVGTQWKLSWVLFEVEGLEIRAVGSQSEFVTRSERPAADAPPLDYRQLIDLRVNDAGEAEYVPLVATRQPGGVIESPVEERRRREEALRRDEVLRHVDWSRAFDLARAPSFDYAWAEGCMDLSLTAFTRDRAELIRVLIDKRGLGLDRGPRVVDLARERRASVTIRMYAQALRESPFCSRRRPLPASEAVWRAVKGTLTIELSSKRIARNPELYRATVRLENLELTNADGNRIRRPSPLTLSGLVGGAYTYQY